jgi:hypothetical protein
MWGYKHAYNHGHSVPTKICRHEEEEEVYLVKSNTGHRPKTCIKTYTYDTIKLERRTNHT